MKKEMKKEEFKINCRNLWIIVYHSHPINLIPKQHKFRSEYPESRMKNGQRSICPWTRAAWKPDKKASSILGGLPPPTPWIPCVLGTR